MIPDWLQAAVLAIIQGLTEFLPVSSSGHLLLPSLLLGWQDQGLAFDVAVHLGSLLAVLAYFRHDLWRIAVAWLGSLRHLPQRVEGSGDARLAWCLIVATLPAAAAGVLLHDIVSGLARSLWVVGATSIGFGILLLLAERYADRYAGHQRQDLAEVNLKTALQVGLAQALSLIPGTSRAGVTMTAALFCGFSKQAASRFSFLLAIPVIAASGLFTAADLLAAPQEPDWMLLAGSAALSGVVAFACIHFFLRLIARIGFLPFVVYRLLLGGVLLLLAASGGGSL